MKVTDREIATPVCSGAFYRVFNISSTKRRMENFLETLRKVPSKVTAYFTIAESATDYPVNQNST